MAARRSPRPAKQSYLRDTDIRTPKDRNEVWLHVDRLDKHSSRRVWAVQWVDRSGKAHRRVAERVMCVWALAGTVFCSGPRQPRAYIRFPESKVLFAGTHAFISPLKEN